MPNDNKSLPHTKWNCKYHIVFAPKYCRQVFFGEKRAAIGRILRQLREWKGIEIHEAEICPDHVHMLVSIPPKVSVGKNKQKIAEYIRHQLDEDKLGEQMTMFGKDDDPFKGGR